MRLAPAEGEEACFHALNLSPVDLIRSPRGDDVLSDVWTGASTQSGDLTLSLLGWGTSNRDCIAAWTAGNVSFGRSTIPSADDPRLADDSLCTTAMDRSAELPTMPLRRRPQGRCAASWITSETVSGDIQLAREVIPPKAPEEKGT